MTLTQIAAEFGVTKNTVCGKVGRLRQMGMLPRHQVREGPKLPEPKDLGLKPLKVHGEALNYGECGYVFGTPWEDKWAYCGRPATERGIGGGAWCEHHVKVVRQQKKG
jgi:hypothetical protein